MIKSEMEKYIKKYKNGKLRSNSAYLIPFLYSGSELRPVF